jgi:hypothetical protein
LSLIVNDIRYLFICMTPIFLSAYRVSLQAHVKSYENLFFQPDLGEHLHQPIQTGPQQQQQ